MTWFQWVLVIGGYLLVNYLALRWLRWNTFFPVPGRHQDVRAVCARQATLDVEGAVAEAIGGEKQIEKSVVTR